MIFKMIQEVPETEMFTVRQAAAFLNVRPSTIRRWAHQSQLSGKKIGFRGDWRFTKQELNALMKPNPSSTGMAGVVHPTRHDLPRHNHLVQFYENDSYLLDSVKSFIEDGDVAVVIATPEHRAQLEKDLRIGGIHASEARQEGRYFSFDAAETLSRFMVDGIPDPKLFIEVIGSVIEKAASQNRKVHAFGEMVALLWQAGNPEAAIQLEKLWNELQNQHEFKLFCAYPIRSFAGDANMSGFIHVCNTHSAVIPSESYSPSASEETRLREIALLQQKAESLEMEISRTRQLTQQLQERNIELDDFFENGALSVHWVGRDGKILRANKAELEMLGYSEEEYVGHNIREFHVEPSIIDGIFERLHRGEVLHNHEAQLRCKDGSIKHVLIDSNVLWKNGEFIHTRCFTRNITDRRRHEEMAREEERRKDEFLAILAHELRNPLAPISSAAQVLELTGSTSEDDKWAIDVIHRQLHNMTRLIDDLLDVSRISRNKLDLRKEKVSVADILEAAIETSGPAIKEGQHQLITSFPAQKIYIEGDMVRLSQTISNLLTNAAKYTPPQGTIWLTLTEENSQAVIQVRDTGRGLSAEMIPRIFDMFVQVEQSPRQGLGIGLTLARRLLEMHHGTIEAESKGLNQGSTFTVRLPVITPGAIEGRDDKTDSVAASQLRILVADDNKDALDAMAMTLSLQGHRVAIASDGLEAVRSAKEFLPDAILMDIGMPNTDGYEAAALIRSEEWGRNMKLIAVTGWGQSADKAKAEEAGFDHHMTKPVDSTVLSRLLASIES